MQSELDTWIDPTPKHDREQRRWMDPGAPSLEGCHDAPIVRTDQMPMPMMLAYYIRLLRYRRTLDFLVC